MARSARLPLLLSLHLLLLPVPPPVTCDIGRSCCAAPEPEACLLPVSRPTSSRNAHTPRTWTGGSSEPLQDQPPRHRVQPLRGAGRDEVLGTGPFGEIDGESAREILREVERLSREDLASSYEDSDRNPPVFDPATHTAPVPASFKASYQAWMDSSFGGCRSSRRWAARRPLVADLGDRRDGARRQRPRLDVRRGSRVRQRGPPQRQRARPGRRPVHGRPPVGLHHGPHRAGRGSVVGAGRAKAVPNDDGSWNITGVKRFITSATHDMSENIMHLVLARPEGVDGAGGPGHEGPLALLDARAPLRPRDRRADR